MKRVFCWMILWLVPLAHGQPSPYTNSNLGTVTLTASGQTSAAQPLGTATGNSFASGAITLTGTSLTTATFGVLCSTTTNATGSFFPILINAVATPGTTATTITATANGIYMVNLAACKYIKYVTSGTFTGTSITLQLTATPNGLISRSAGGSSSSFITSLTTTGTSGAATVSGGVLNIPIYGGGTAAIGALVETTTGQALVAFTPTIISFATVVHDDASFFSAGTPTVLTVPAGQGGWYAISCNIALDGTASTNVFTFINRNGTSIAPFQQPAPGGSGNTLAVTAGQINYFLSAGDTISVSVEGTSGTSNTIAGSTLSIVKL
jgi:hypothetical protein